MDTILTVKNEDLEHFNPREAVGIFRQLLWAEARRLEIAISKIRVSSWIDDPDGGIDALVEENNVLMRNDLIKVGLTSFQIKAGSTFKPWQKGQIKKALFGKKYPSKKNLGTSVKDCLDRNGTYVLVCFKQDPTEPQYKQALRNLEDYFKQCGYQTPRAQVWVQNNLIGFLEIFPSLALKVNRRGTLRFQIHQSWSQEAEMKRGFKAGQAQKDFISNMQNELRQNSGAVHIRVWGEPGIGKTRLVLEATRIDDLEPLVIYCDAAGNFRDSDLMNEILRDDNQFSAILVIDECDPDSRSYIWNKLKYRGPRVKLVSIYNEYDYTSGNINYLNAPPLNQDQISKIIQEYLIPRDQADRWAEFCSGSPRVAHVFGQNVRNNPEDLLKSPGTVNVWDRYIIAGDDPNSEQVHQRRLALQHIALFKRFGYGGPVGTEARAVAKIAGQADPQLTWSRFQEIIHKLKARRILQGENTLYITPKALHIKLWIDWWNTYGEGFRFEEFSKDLPDALCKWFYEMFEYAKESEVASRIVEELLGENGPFQNSDYLKTELGASFFLALTKPKPESALECLKRTIGTWNKEELLQFTTGRRAVVWALEIIAIQRELFSDAAKLLLALGEAENETWSNNASGVFAELFSPAPGQVAPTRASPQERFPVLSGALESNSKEQRLLALRACDQALESQHFVRTIGAERQGLQKEPQRWMPTTYGELWDAYRRVWQLLSEQLDSFPEDEQQQAVTILLRRARGLGGIPNLADMVINTVYELTKKPHVDKKKVLAEVVRILHYGGKNLPSQTRKRWEQLTGELTGRGFSSLMKRYVGMFLLEDEFDEQGNQINQTQLRVEELAQQAIEDNELLRPELAWLVTTEPQNGYPFGYQLGKRDRDFSLLPSLLKAQRNAGPNASVYFLGGYFRTVFEKNQRRWEKLLGTLTEDEKINVWVPELTFRSGMSDQAALRILDLAEKGVIDIGQFRMFTWGHAIKKLSEGVFKKLIHFLLGSSNTDAIFIALDLYFLYYVYRESKHTLPEQLTLRLLTHQLLWQKSEAGRRSHRDDYHWTGIGKVFVKRYPKRSLELADKMLEHFGEEGTIVGGFHPETQVVLNEITRQYPKEVWIRIAKYLGPPIDSRAFHIKEWLRGGEFFKEKGGALLLIPREKIWEWVGEDVEKRAWYLASFVPKTLFREKGKICLAREVLVRYGTREDVRSNLRANFSTEGWSGPESLHYQRKKQQLLDFKKEEDNENVTSWIREYVSSLDRMIERAKNEEEREDF